MSEARGGSELLEGYLRLKQLVMTDGRTDTDEGKLMT